MMDALCYKMLPIAVLLFQFLGSANGFSCPSWWGVVGIRRTTGMEWALAAESSSSSSSSSSTQQNEFSRPLSTDRILKTSSGKQRRTYREYETTIAATPDECSALAQRFELRQLSSLQAELSLSLPPHLNAAGKAATSYLTVQVEGSIVANITQTCVRTNEDFDMTVEFPMAAIVKPVSFNNNNNLARKDTEEQDSTFSSAKKKKSKNSSSRRNKVVDMLDLQQMIEESASNAPRPSSSIKKNRNIRKDYDTTYDDDDLYNYFGTEEIVEDESIYSSLNGILDVGELVAQTFYLNLDRYPKKPGTGPLEYTISG